VRFLECRAREMVSGGKLVLATPGDTSEARVADGLYDVLNDACLDLIATGRLARPEYERFTMPIYCRTVAELRAPLERKDSPGCGAFAVERVEEVEVPTDYIVEFRRGGDLAAYAGDYTGFLRAISEPVVRATLDRPDAQATVDSLFY